MVDVARVLAFQYPTAVNLVDYVVVDDGTGPRLVQWNQTLGPQPTPTALATIETSAPYLAWIAPAAVTARDPAATLRAQAAQAITDIETYLAIPTPTAAQVAAAVRRLAQISEALVKRLVQIS